MGITILIYGDTKVGKTLDSANALRKGIFLLSEPDGLASAKAHLGFVPDNIELTNLDAPEVELQKSLNHLEPLIKAGKYSSIILDTGSELADRLLASYRQRFPKNGYKAFGFVQDQIKYTIRRIQTMGANFVMLCHESPPMLKDGIFCRGGPLMPSKQLVQSIPPMFSIIMHAYIHPKFGRVYDCNRRETQWQLGDRYGATADLQPLDLRPIVFRAMFPGKEVPDFPTKTIREVACPFGNLEELEKEEKKNETL